MFSQVCLLEIRKLLHHIKSNFGTFEISKYIYFTGLFKLSQYIYVNSSLLNKKGCIKKHFITTYFEGTSLNIQVLKKKLRKHMCFNFKFRLEKYFLKYVTGKVLY